MITIIDDFLLRVITYLHIRIDEGGWDLLTGCKTDSEPNTTAIKPNHTYKSYTKINR